MQRINHKASNPIQQLLSVISFNRTLIVKPNQFVEDLWEEIAAKQVGTNRLVKSRAIGTDDYEIDLEVADRMFPNG